MWAYFALRAGWLKINVGTNLGPQIYMYLSALGFHFDPLNQDSLTDSYVTVPYFDDFGNISKNTTVPISLMATYEKIHKITYVIIP